MCVKYWPNTVIPNKLTFFAIDVIQEVNGVFYNTITDITVVAMNIKKLKCIYL